VLGRTGGGCDLSLRDVGMMEPVPEEAADLVRPMAADRLAIVQDGFEKRDLGEAHY
jgi:hypothetical protein